VHPCYLSAWLKKEPGALLVEMERAQLQRLLKPVVGNSLVQIGGLPELTEGSRIRSWFLNTQAKSGAIPVDLQALPLAQDSVDVIVMVHVLEFTEQPLVVLREAYRALAPGGQFIVLGLNPWSLWGLKHSLTQDHDFPWNGHFWAGWRVRHWLRDIGLRIVMSDTFCFRPPLHSLRWWQRLLWLEALGPFCFPAWGGFYIIAAQKRAVGMTPLAQPLWRPAMSMRVFK
jgi:SAM-dependent methyltransferase